MLCILLVLAALPLIFLLAYSSRTPDANAPDAQMHRDAPEYAALTTARNTLGDHTVLYAHGFGAVPEEAIRFADVKGPLARLTVDNERRLVPVALHAAYRVPLLDPTRTHAISCSPWPWYDIGGEADAGKFASYAAEFIRAVDRPHILFGMSRGSATVFNALTILCDEPDWETVLRPRIAFVVCAGIFASVDNVIRSRFPWPLSALVSWALSRRSLGFAWRGGNEPWAPVNRVPHLPGGVPIGIIAAEDDEKVPVTTTRRLVSAIEAENERRPPEDAIRLQAPLYVAKGGHQFSMAPRQQKREMMAYMAQLYLLKQ